MLILGDGWAFQAGRDWSLDNDTLFVRLAWDRYHAPEGVVPYRKEVWFSWTPLRAYWRTFSRAWGRLDRRHDCGAWDATAWTGRTTELISVHGGPDWGKRGI